MRQTRISLDTFGNRDRGAPEASGSVMPAGPTNLQVRIRLLVALQREQIVLGGRPCQIFSGKVFQPRKLLIVGHIRPLQYLLAGLVLQESPSRP